MILEPFPHLILEDSTVHDNDLIASVNQYWPAQNWPGWMQYSETCHTKRASNVVSELPPVVGECLRRVALLPWGEWMDQKGLVPDLGLWGAGLHEMRPGERVSCHLDADYHPRLGLERRLSVMLYVHSRWESDWGGELELWDGTSPVVSIEPLSKRLVALDTRGPSYHSVAPVCCPTGLTRRSLCLFFYGPQSATFTRARAKFMVS